MANECKERGYHSWAPEKNEPYLSIEDCNDDYTEMYLVLKCRDCGATCEMQGEWEKQNIKAS